MISSVSETPKAYEASHQPQNVVTSDELKKMRFQPTEFGRGREQVSVDRFLHV